MARMMLESVVPAILSLILGPFSDRFGRKLILNSTSLGLTLYFASLCVLKYLTPYLPISPWYYALSVLFFSLSGGFSVILTGVLSHTTDSSTERNRSERFVTNSL
jgi:PCFT/HCP family folate transporter-like MFS transporter 1/3